MKVELLRGCPDADGNYSDAGCDDYDTKPIDFERLLGKIYTLTS